MCVCLCVPVSVLFCFGRSHNLLAMAALSVGVFTTARLSHIYNQSRIIVVGSKHLADAFREAQANNDLSGLCSRVGKLLSDDVQAALRLDATDAQRGLALDLAARLEVMVSEEKVVGVYANGKSGKDHLLKLRWGLMCLELTECILRVGNQATVLEGLRLFPDRAVGGKARGKGRGKENGQNPSKGLGKGKGQGKDVASGKGKGKAKGKLPRSWPPVE